MIQTNLWLISKISDGVVKGGIMSYYSQTQSNPITELSNTNDNPITVSDSYVGFHVLHKSPYVINANNTNNDDDDHNDNNASAEVELDEDVDRHLMQSNYSSLLTR